MKLGLKIHPPGLPAPPWCPIITPGGPIPCPVPKQIEWGVTIFWKRSGAWPPALLKKENPYKLPCPKGKEPRFCFQKPYDLAVLMNYFVFEASPHDDKTLGVPPLQLPRLGIKMVLTEISLTDMLSMGYDVATWVVRMTGNKMPTRPDFSAFEDFFALSFGFNFEIALVHGGVYTRGFYLYATAKASVYGGLSFSFELEAVLRPPGTFDGMMKLAKDPLGNLNAGIRLAANATLPFGMGEAKFHGEVTPTKFELNASQLIKIAGYSMRWKIGVIAKSRNHLHYSSAQRMLIEGHEELNRKGLHLASGHGGAGAEVLLSSGVTLGPLGYVDFFGKVSTYGGLEVRAHLKMTLQKVLDVNGRLDCKVNQNEAYIKVDADATILIPGGGGPRLTVGGELSMRNSRPYLYLTLTHTGGWTPLPGGGDLANLFKTPAFVGVVEIGGQRYGTYLHADVEWKQPINLFGLLKLTGSGNRLSKGPKLALTMTTPHNSLNLNYRALLDGGAELTLAKGGPAFTVRGELRSHGASSLSIQALDTWKPLSALDFTIPKFKGHVRISNGVASGSLTADRVPTFSFTSLVEFIDWRATMAFNTGTSPPKLALDASGSVRLGGKKGLVARTAVAFDTSKASASISITHDGGWVPIRALPHIKSPRFTANMMINSHGYALKLDASLQWDKVLWIVPNLLYLRALPRKDTETLSSRDTVLAATQKEELPASNGSAVANLAYKRCDGWCRGHSSPWETKCAWSTNACSGCSECRTLGPSMSFKLHQRWHQSMWFEMKFSAEGVLCFFGEPSFKIGFAGRISNEALSLTGSVSIDVEGYRISGTASYESATKSVTLSAGVTLPSPIGWRSFTWTSPRSGLLGSTATSELAAGNTSSELAVGGIHELGSTCKPYSLALSFDLGLIKASGSLSISTKSISMSGKAKFFGASATIAAQITRTQFKLQFSAGTGKISIDLDAGACARYLAKLEAARLDAPDHSEHPHEASLGHEHWPHRHHPEKLEAARLDAPDHSEHRHEAAETWTRLDSPQPNMSHASDLIFHGHGHIPVAKAVKSGVKVVKKHVIDPAVKAANDLKNAFCGGSHIGSVQMNLDFDAILKNGRNPTIDGKATVTFSWGSTVRGFIGGRSKDSLSATLTVRSHYIEVNFKLPISIKIPGIGNVRDILGNICLRLKHGSGSPGLTEC